MRSKGMTAIPSRPSAVRSRAFVGERRQAEDRGFRPKTGARMRLEGEHHRRHLPLAGFIDGGLEEGRMTAVDAVEIADGDDAAGEFRRDLVEQVGDQGRTARILGHRRARRGGRASETDGSPGCGQGLPDKPRDEAAGAEAGSRQCLATEAAATGSSPPKIVGMDAAGHEEHVDPGVERRRGGRSRAHRRWRARRFDRWARRQSRSRRASAAR